MSKKTLVLLGIIGLLTIFMIYSWLHRSSIEQDVANCSQDILNKAGLTQLSAQTENRGRDVLIVGVVESQQLKEKALNLLKDQCHMTNLESQVTVVVAKPTTNANIRILFNEKNELVNFTGTTAKETVETKFGFLLDSFKRAKDFKLSINSNKDVIPVDYYLYTSTLKPYFNQINAADVSYNGQTITLKGRVDSEQVKNQIFSELKKALGNNTKLVNLLTITIEEKNTAIIQPLDVNHCQQDLSRLLEKSKVHFNSGSAEILEGSFDLLNQLAQTTKACQGVSVEIIGHTDKSGNESNNIKLSKARALAVANYLFKQGVKGGKLTGKGVGSSQPIASNETKQGRMQNRRIEFKVHSLTGVKK